MENNIKVEQWLGNEIRFVEVNNEWYAVGIDVAKALGYKDYRGVVRNKVKNKTYATIFTSGQNRKVALIKRDAIKTLVVNSRLSSAWDFLSHLENNHDFFIHLVPPKQTQFEILLREQIQRFYDKEECTYTAWDYYVGHGVLLPEALDFKTEYKVPGTNYKVDFYIDGFDIVIDYGEKHHINQLEADVRREAEITNAMLDNCDRFPYFIRVEEGKEYQGIIDIFAFMLKRSA